MEMENTQEYDKSVDEPLWEGKPSQWKNLNTYVFSTLFCWLILPLFYAFWKYLEVKTERYQLTLDRIIHKEGVLSTVENEIETIRIKDVSLEQPLLLRAIGLYNLRVVTSDSTHKMFRFECIQDGQLLRQLLHKQIKRSRASGGVLELR